MKRIALVALLLLGACRQAEEPAPVKPESLSVQERALRQQEACAYRNVQRRHHNDALALCKNLKQYPSVAEREACASHEDAEYSKIFDRVTEADMACEAGR